MTTKHSFEVNSLIPEEPEGKYRHGFSDAEVEKIKKLKKEIDKRDLIESPVTLQEFKEVIIPWNRIHRTEVFNLNIKEKKVTKKKTPAPKTPKEKKLTKKAIEKKLNDIVFKQATGEALSSEEQKFFEEHITDIGKL